MEIKILRRVRAESSRRPPRHRRDACSNPTHWLISTQLGTRDVARDGLHHVREVRRQAQDLFHFFLVQSTLLFSGEKFQTVPLFREVRGGDHARAAGLGAVSEEALEHGRRRGRARI